jgi:bifunctional DNase/RNase
MSLVKLTIKGISYSQTQNGAYALILNEVDGERKLPIVIGAFEAQSIAIALEKEIKPPRPLTHDLFKNFADRFDIVVKQVIIHKLVDGVFYSSIICERDKIEEIIDARTSDAIALALRFNAPIFTYKNILEKAGIYLKSNPLEANTASQDADNVLVRLRYLVLRKVINLVTLMLNKAFRNLLNFWRELFKMKTMKRRLRLGMKFLGENRKCSVIMLGI